MYVILVGHRHSDKYFKARMSMRLTCALAAASRSITRPGERSLAVLLLHRMLVLQAQPCLPTCISYVSPLGAVLLTYMYSVCQSCRRRSNIWTRALY